MKNQTIPCIDCITFSICNSILSPVLDIAQKGIVLKLYDRCSIMRDYVTTNKSTETIDELGIKYDQLCIDYDRLELVRQYFKEFKRRDQCSKG